GAREYDSFVKAVVMAGGQGTRLRPLTSNQPKPMLPIVGRPMMEHVLGLLREHGVTDVVATVQFLASVIRNYFGDGSDLGLALSYVTEDEPLGTAGSVKNAEHVLDDTFLVMSGDHVTDLDLTAALKHHRDREAAVTVIVKRTENPLEFGIVIADEDGRIERFLEKPGWGEVFSDTINTGIYVVEPEVLAHIPPGEEFDFASDLFPVLLDKGLPLHAFVAEGYWADVGNLDAYLDAHRDILDGKVGIKPSGFELEGGVWLGEGAEVDPGAEVEGPAYIGDNARVEAGATVRDHTVLGRGVVVKSGAFLHRAVVHDHAYVGTSASLRGCVLGKNADVKHGARLEEGVVVSDECYVGEGAVLSPHVKVYPFKTVDPGALVTQSIVWETRGARGLFGERGVSGLVNIDVTPEMSLRLALAYGGTLPKKSVVAAARDPTRTARIIKRSMVAGLNAAGLDCHDLELVPVPVARFYARSEHSAGGIAVRTSPNDPQSVDIVFFDDRGIDIDPGAQRKIERAYYRDDLRRAFHHDLGELNFPPRGREYYLRGLLDAVDDEAIRRAAPKIVVDYQWGAAVLTAPAVAGRIGADILAVNAVLDDGRAPPTEEETRAHLERLSALVRSGGADLGAAFDPTGERIRLVEDGGRTLGLDEALLVYVDLVTRAVPKARIAVPVTTTRAVEDLVRSRGGEVVWTKVSASALCAAGEEGGVVFAGAEGGGYVFPEFLPAYDAVMSLAKLLELLARSETKLSEVAGAMPPVHVARLDVPTPWEAKGTVMRRLVERLNGEKTVTIDGVKAYRGRDWALVIPHPQEPVVRVWAEAEGPDGSRAMAEEFGSLVEELRE
ncbi:MAG TPA: sugar phosphate nucleotidyltransferase, partial [Actinomycetota bacterium]|nr:sugar phosphate nucleotidyltransferase [Actinomycetota bacterium]